MSTTGPARSDRADGGPADPPLPTGFGVVIDPGTKQLGEDTLFGGTPARVLRLSRAGRAALAELRSGPVRSAAAGRLARKLTDAGLASPLPPRLAAPPDTDQGYRRSWLVWPESGTGRRPRCIR